MIDDLNMKLQPRMRARRMHGPRSSVPILSCLVMGLVLLGLGEARAVAEVGPAAAAKAPAGACADDRSVATAREEFARGVGLADRGDYQGALQAFEAAYAACPHFAVWYNIGQALIELDRPLDAIAALLRYQREGQDHIPPERSLWVQAQIRQLKAVLGELHVTTVPPGALVTVDGRAVGRTPLAEAIQLEPGLHKIWATLDDYAPAASSVSIGKGQRHEVVMHLNPLPAPGGAIAEIDLAPPSPPPPSRARAALPYALLGTGVALAGAAVGAYLWERHVYGEWQAAQPELRATLDYPPLRGSPEYAQAANENNRLAGRVTTAKHALWGFAIASGALLTTGALLYRFDRPPKARAASPAIAWNGGASFTAGWSCAW